MWLPILSETSSKCCSWLQLLIIVTLVSSIPIPGSRGRYLLLHQEPGSSSGKTACDWLGARFLECWVRVEHVGLLSKDYHPHTCTS